MVKAMCRGQFGELTDLKATPIFEPLEGQSTLKNIKGFSIDLSIKISDGCTVNMMNVHPAELTIMEIPDDIADRVEKSTAVGTEKMKNGVPFAFALFSQGTLDILRGEKND